MARFYAEIIGIGGKATHTSTKNSGMRAHVRGWEIGARVVMSTHGYGADVVDVCTVYLTSGSNGGKSDKCIWSGTRADFDALVGERKEG